MIGAFVNHFDIIFEAHIRVLIYVVASIFCWRIELRGFGLAQQVLYICKLMPVNSP